MSHNDWNHLEMSTDVIEMSLNKTNDEGELEERMDVVRPDLPQQWDFQADVSIRRKFSITSVT